MDTTGYYSSSYYSSSYTEDEDETVETEYEATEEDAATDSASATDAEGDITETQSGNGSVSDSEDFCKMVCRLCNTLRKIYKNRFQRQLISSTLIFFMALKLANECYGLRIPSTEWPP